MSGSLVFRIRSYHLCFFSRIWHSTHKFETISAIFQNLLFYRLLVLLNICSTSRFWVTRGLRFVIFTLLFELLPGLFKFAFRDTISHGCIVDSLNTFLFTHEHQKSHRFNSTPFPLVAVLYLGVSHVRNQMQRTNHLCMGTCWGQSGIKKSKGSVCVFLTCYGATVATSLLEQHCRRVTSIKYYSIHTQTRLYVQEYINICLKCKLNTQIILLHKLYNKITHKDVDTIILFLHIKTETLMFHCTYLKISYVAFTGAQASKDDGIMWVKVCNEFTGQRGDLYSNVHSRPEAFILNSSFIIHILKLCFV